MTATSTYMKLLADLTDLSNARTAEAEDAAHDKLDDCWRSMSRVERKQVDEMVAQKALAGIECLVLERELTKSILGALPDETIAQAAERCAKHDADVEFRTVERIVAYLRGLDPDRTASASEYADYIEAGDWKRVLLRGPH